MVPRHKTAVVVGMLIVIATASVWAQEPPPPPPPPGPAAAPGPPPGPPPPPPAAKRPRYRARVVFNLSFPLMIQAEFAIGRWLTLMGGIGGIALKFGDSDNSFYWVDTMVGLNIHFTGRAPHGWWAGLRSHHGWMKWTDDDDDVYIGVAKALLGYTWIFRSRFTLGLGLGVQYIYVALRNSGADKVVVEGVWPAGELNMGVAF